MDEQQAMRQDAMAERQADRDETAATRDHDLSMEVMEHKAKEAKKPAKDGART